MIRKVSTQSKFKCDTIIIPLKCVSFKLGNFITYKLDRKLNLAYWPKAFELIKQTLGIFYNKIYSSSLDWY